MSTHKDELVVVLHGIGMSPFRMLWQERCLKKAGYDVLNLSYPSRRKTIEDSAIFVEDKIRHYSKDHHSKIHFVAHSLGTLITMDILARNIFNHASRAVLIAPPYGGSEMADFLQHWPIYKRLFGPAGQQLTTLARKDAHRAVPDHIEFGVIAGTRSWEYPHAWFTMRHVAPHDGLVSIASTQIPGCRDYTTIRMSHSLLLEVSAAQVLHFLEHGRFKHAQNNLAQNNL
jgi:triacylglycerol lipase